MSTLATSAPVSPAEAAVVEEIARRSEDLVALLVDLVRFDTQTHALDEPPRQERALQEHLATRLGAAGLEVDLWEPARGSVPSDRLRLGPDFHFEGRPQLLARARGVGGGRSLLFNGHIDTVTAEPGEGWPGHPLGGEVRDGRVVGRGACDMKAGVAAMVFATEVLRGQGVVLRGDLLVNTVTDEESTAAGTLASIARGARADGAVVPEPTGLRAWLGTRGSLMPTITVDGRAGHAGLRQPHFSAGGAVNAVEKMALVLGALGRLREEWRERPEHQHPHLDPPGVVAVEIAGGEWIVTQPGSCRLRCHVQYLPAQADEDGGGSLVERELEEWLAAAAATDPWLARHPPRVSWTADVPPSYLPPDDPIAATALEAAADLGLPGGVDPHTTWYDGATLVRHGTPTIGFGPGRIEDAHTVGESVGIDELVRAAQALAVIAMRFCGR